MKTFKLTLSLIVLIPLFSFSQPQWKFHVAFEDATGAKDTIWFIWDTTATIYGIDTLLGEGNPNMDYNVFNVWTLTGGAGTGPFDTTKVVAYPYYGDFSEEIKAINFVLPITISWDSALFHADWLPSEPVGWVNYARIANNYFFLYGNTDFDHNFDMTLENNVIEPYPGNNDPWAWEDWVHFPMAITLMQDPTLSISQPKAINPQLLSAYPNPFTNQTTFEIYLDNEAQAEIYIYSLKGELIRTISNEKLNQGITQIKWNGLNNASQACGPGLYIAFLKINGITQQTVKLLKQ
ncbi:MAG TPA: T9SS type A sorting domain-containing protein [Bacteroidales bacterium]